MVLNILGALVLGSVTSGHLPVGNSSNEKHREKVSSDKEALKQSPVLKVNQSMEQEGDREGKRLWKTSLLGEQEELWWYEKRK